MAEAEPSFSNAVTSVRPTTARSNAVCQGRFVKVALPPRSPSLQLLVGDANNKACRPWTESAGQRLRKSGNPTVLPVKRRTRGFASPALAGFALFGVRILLFRGALPLLSMYRPYVGNPQPCRAPVCSGEALQCAAQGAVHGALEPAVTRVAARLSTGVFVENACDRGAWRQDLGGLGRREVVAADGNRRQDGARSALAPTAVTPLAEREGRG